MHRCPLPHRHAGNWHQPLATILCGFAILFAGCSGKKTEVDASGDGPTAAATETESGNEDDNTGTSSAGEGVSTSGGAVAPAEPGLYEISAEGLLAAQLPPEQLQDGWVRLFDGQTLFGWFIAGQANWVARDGVVSVSEGERSYLCTSFRMADYELMVDFRCDPKTNSGIFLRTGPQPEDVATKALELNIAPPDNPFPTGSFVQRQKLEPTDLGTFDPEQWHTYHVRLVGNRITVRLDGQQIMDFEDDLVSPTGHISLQHNEGRVEFRNILLRPVHWQDLRLSDNWSDDWTKTTKDDAELSVEPIEGGLRLTGGLGQLQSKADFGDFFLGGSYTLARPEVNAGIFFRCIRDNMLDGYECQVNHATIDDNPLQPGDAGAGGIFRRQDARIVVGDGTRKTHVSLIANGAQMMTWVNGVAVVDFADSREPDENPRRGLRTDPGPISLQAHDPETDVTFHMLRVSELAGDTAGN